MPTWIPGAAILIAVVFAPACGRLHFEHLEQAGDGTAARDASDGARPDSATGDLGASDGSPADAEAPGPSWPGCVADVGVATVSTCILFRDGHVECAGQNLRGQLGDGTGQTSRTLVRSLNLEDAVRLSPAAWGHCALHADRTVSCWGDSGSGRFGSLGPENIFEPTRIPEFTDVRDFEAGTTSSCVVFMNGDVLCMGDNNVGQHGNGTTDPSPTPVPVDLPGQAIAVASGWGGHAVVMADGQVFAWGASGSGGWLSPTNPGITGVVDLDAHAPAYFARRDDGSLWAWGRNESGQLGDGTIEPRATPAAVMGLSNVQSAAGGGDHACAVLAGGEVRCWGANGAYLKLGVEGVTESTTPLPVEGLPPAVQIRAGQEHTCAIVEDGSVWCWGHDGSGQMATGERAEGRLPTEVPITCP